MSMSDLRRTLAPIGTRGNGEPIWPYAGSAPEGGGDASGAEGADGDTDGGDEGAEDDGTVGEDGLTAKGRRALEQERQANKRLRAALKPLSELRQQTGLTVDEMRAKLLATTSTTTSATTSTSDGKAPATVDVDELRRQITREVTQKSNDRLIKAAVREQAAAVLNDPADAVKFLDLSDYQLGDDGEVDARQIQQDLRALLDDKPYLAKVTRKTPDFDGGSRGSTSGKVSMNDLIRQTARRR